MSPPPDEAKIKRFVDVLNALVDSEDSPRRGNDPRLHEQRRKLWGEMTEVERQIARAALGDRGRWC